MPTKVQKPKPVAQREMFHAREDGTTEQKVVPIYLDDNMFFRIDLPPYINDGKPIFDERLASIIDAYETACDHYCMYVHVRSKGTPVIALAKQNEYGVTLDYRKGARTYGARLYAESGLSVIQSGHVILSDTPEVRAKLERMADSVERARVLLLGLESADDPTTYLLSIPEIDAAPPAPVQEIPLVAPPVAASVSPDDDEL